VARSGTPFDGRRPKCLSVSGFKLYRVERSRDRGACRSSIRTHPPRYSPFNRRLCCAAANLFFVRVNQVLVRLWARAMKAGVYPLRPVVRLMSDRESVSAVSRPVSASPSGMRP
jgi:hypothetical protein